MFLLVNDILSWRLNNVSDVNVVLFFLAFYWTPVFRTFLQSKRPLLPIGWRMLEVPPTLGEALAACQSAFIVGL
jgi:hypothetical protein